MMARITGMLAGVLPIAASNALEKPYPGMHFEDEQLLMVIIPRTPEQMAAFYEARGFPQRAIDRVKATCFITVHIDNKGDGITWLETANWQLRSKQQALTILGSDYWDTVWESVDLPQSYRSTFFWTQLPPVVDLHPDEPVGGNIVLPGDTGSFSIEANFNTGADRRGKQIQVKFDNVTCPQDPVTP